MLIVPTLCMMGLHPGWHEMQCGKVQKWQKKNTKEEKKKLEDRSGNETDIQQAGGLIFFALGLLTDNVNLKHTSSS